MYVRACADDGCASVGIEIHSFLVARVITALCLLPRRNVGNRIMVFSTALWQKCWIP